MRRYARQVRISRGGGGKTRANGRIFNSYKFIRVLHFREKPQESFYERACGAFYYRLYLYIRMSGAETGGNGRYTIVKLPELRLYYRRDAALGRET